MFGGFGASGANNNPGTPNPFASFGGSAGGPAASSNPSNAFGTSSSFGAPSTAPPSSAPVGGGGFGQSSGSGFGGFGSAPPIPAFGSSSTSQGFGTGSAPSSAAGFGTQASSSNPFGGATMSAFGSTTQPSTTTFGGNTQSTFGTSQPQATPAFGGSAQVTATPFGSNPQQPMTTTGFGGSSSTAFGTSSQPQSATAFGTSSNQPQPQFGQQSFGQPSSTAFGSSQPFSSAASSSPFGPTQQTTTTTTFGSKPSQPTTSFGSSIQQSPAPAFGSKPATTFGSSQPPAFGSSSDSKPAFGGSFGGGAKIGKQVASTGFGDAAKSNPFAAAASGGSAGGVTFGSKQGASSSSSSPVFGHKRGTDSSFTASTSASNPFAAAAAGGADGTNSPSAGGGKVAFGQPSTFGAKPTFGGNNNNKKFGGKPPTPPLPDEMPTPQMRVKPVTNNPFAAAAAAAGTGAPPRGRSPMRGGRMGQRMMRKSPPPSLSPSPPGSPERNNYNYNNDNDNNDDAISSGTTTTTTLSTEKAELATAINLDGTCIDMCSASERELHLRVDELSVFEKNFPDAPGNERFLIIKRFQRSSADHKLDIPHEIRPPSVLRQTQLYLETQIMDRERLGVDLRFHPPREPTLIELYNFCWDRMRMIRKDFVLQNYRGAGGRVHPIALDVHERIARYHILSEHELCEEKHFVAQQNMEQLGQTLKSLNELYDESHKLGDPAFGSPFEAEFRAYFILCTLDNGRGLDVLKFVKGLTKPVRESPQVKFAMKAFVARHTNDFYGFFQLVRDSTLLQACLLFRYLVSMRSNALQRMNRAYRKQAFAVAELTELLCFDDLEHAKSVCTQHGLRLETRASDDDGVEGPTTGEQEFILFGGSFESDIQLRRNKKPLPVQGAWAYILPKQGHFLRKDICRGVTEYTEATYPSLSQLIQVTELQEFKQLHATRASYEDKYSSFADYHQQPPTTLQLPPAASGSASASAASASTSCLATPSATPTPTPLQPDPTPAQDEFKRKQLEEIMKRKAQIELQQKLAKEKLQKLEEDRKAQAKAKEREEQAKAEAKQMEQQRQRAEAEAQAKAKAEEELKQAQAQQAIARAKAQEEARQKQQKLLEDQKRRHQQEQEAQRKRQEQEQARALQEAQAREEARRREAALKAAEEARKQRLLAEAEAKRQREAQIREEKRRKLHLRKRKQVLAVLQLRWQLWRKYTQRSRGLPDAKPVRMNATRLLADQPPTRPPGQTLAWLFGKDKPLRQSSSSTLANGGIGITKSQPTVYSKAQDLEKFGSWSALNVAALVLAAMPRNGHHQLNLMTPVANSYGFKLVVADLMDLNNNGSVFGNWCACKLGIRSLLGDDSCFDRFHDVSSAQTSDNHETTLFVCSRYLNGGFESQVSPAQQKRKLLGTNAIILPLVLAELTHCKDLVIWRQRVRSMLSSLAPRARVAVCVLAFCQDDTVVEAQQLKKVETCLRELYQAFAAQIVRVECQLVFANHHADSAPNHQQLLQMVQTLVQYAPPYGALVGVGLRELLEDALLMVVQSHGHVASGCGGGGGSGVALLERELAALVTSLRHGILEPKWVSKDFPAPELEQQLVSPPCEWNSAQELNQVETMLSVVGNVTWPEWARGGLSAVDSLALNWSNCCDFFFAKIETWMDDLVQAKHSSSLSSSVSSAQARKVVSKGRIHDILSGLHRQCMRNESQGVPFTIKSLDHLFPWQQVFETVYTMLLETWVSEGQVVYVESQWLDEWQALRLTNATPAPAMEHDGKRMLKGALNGQVLVSESSLKRSFGLLTTKSKLDRSRPEATTMTNPTAEDDATSTRSTTTTCGWKPVMATCESAQLKRLKRDISLGHREAQAFQAYLHQQLSKWTTTSQSVVE